MLELVADDRQLADGGVQHLLLQLMVPGQDVAEDRGQQEQQREQRDERVVGDQRSEIVALVVEELVEHGQRVPGRGMALLESVQPCRPASGRLLRPGRHRRWW